MTTLAAICDAIAAEVNALCTGAWATANSATAVTASRSYLYSEKLEDKTALGCRVSPASKGTGDATRSKSSKDIRVVLTFTKTVASATNEILDPLTKTVELIQEYYQRHAPITGLQAFGVAGTDLDPVYGLRELDEENLFFSLLGLVVQGVE